MFGRLLALPFAIGAMIMLYLTWEVHENYAIYIVPFVLCLAVVYIFSPQINWWYYSRNPPELDAPLREMLLERSPFYQKMNVADQQRFRQRMALFIMGNEFMPQSMEEVPEDIKGIIAMQAVRMTFGQETFILDQFEKFVICPSWFPSPQYPEDFHTSEVYQEDGVILYSAEHLMHSFMQPKQAFNIGLYELAKAYRLNYPDLRYPDLEEKLWLQLEEISRKSRTQIAEYINLKEEEIDLFGVTVVHYFEEANAFEKALPELYLHLKDIFGNQLRP
ncbi:MAG: zinc-dependent peptidase [Saprospiraceae bacterium]|nr:zinc-dependent peptidase [Saprospiraceae bacterium]